MNSLYKSVFGPAFSHFDIVLRLMINNKKQFIEMPVFKKFHTVHCNEIVLATECCT